MNLTAPDKSSLTEVDMGITVSLPCRVFGCAPCRLVVLAVAPFLVSITTAQETSSKPSAGDDLFTNAGIRRLSIEIAPDGIAELRKYRWRRGGSNEERTDVPATVREGAMVWTNVAVHLKGAAGSFRPVDSKPALTLNFDKFADGQRFHGLQKISLNNSVQDPGYLNEKLSREIFARAGIPVPRSDYAIVELNGRALGFYVLVEGWNKQFLRRYFVNVQGNLYDGAFARDINRELPVNSGKNPEDQSEVKALHEACLIPDLSARLARLGELLDLDRFYTLLALDAMMWNWDGYSMNRNNFRLFNDRGSGRLVFMPHGLDQMFWKPDGPIVTGTKGIVAAAVLATPEGRHRCLEKVRDLRSGVFDLTTITNRLNHLADRIRPGVAEMGFGTAVRHSAEVKILRDRIIERVASIDEQLEGARGVLQFERESSPVSLTGWRRQIDAGTPTLDKATNPSALHLRAATPDAAGAWVTTVWLEEGSYRVSARVKTRIAWSDESNRPVGAGLRVRSSRKVTEGANWDWFPFRESRDPESRGHLPALKTSRRLAGTNDWAEITYDFDLRQPMADLEIRCELHSSQGEAWFDLESLQIHPRPRTDRNSEPRRR
jgi:hypothetical protein